VRLAVLCLLTLAPTPAAATPPLAATAPADWPRLHADASRLVAEGKAAEAEPLFRQLLARARAEQGERHLLTGTSWLDLAGALAALGRNAEAEEAYRNALDVVRAGLGAEQAPVAMIEDRLAASLDAQGRYAEAEPLHRRSAELLLRLAGPADAAAAASLGNLAGNLDRQGRYPEAEAIHRRVVAALAGSGPAAGQRLVAEMNLASNLGLQGRHGEAEARYRELIAAIRATGGERSPAMADLLANLAVSLDAQGRSREAEAEHRSALEISRASRGEKAAATAAGYGNLAVNLDHQGRYREAEALHRRALEIRRAALGESHSDTAASYGNLAGNLDEQGRFFEAEPLHRKALAIRRAALGEQHPDTAAAYDALAASLDDRGGCLAAEPFYRKALAIRETRLGAASAATATSYNNLARCLTLQGRAAEAEPLFRHALEIKQARLGERHPDSATALDNLAAVLDAQSRYAEGEPLHRRALEIRRAVLGEAHPETARAANNLAFSLARQGRPGEAEPLLRQALAGLERSLGARHPTTGMAYGALGSNLLAQGKAAAARPLLERSLSILEAALGPGHPELIRTLVDLSASLVETKAGGPRAVDLALRAADLARRLGNASPPPGLEPTEAALARAREPERRRANPAAYAFDAVLDRAWRRHVEAPGEASRLEDAAFAAAQELDVSAAAFAVAQVAARTAEGHGELAALVRREQDLSARVRKLDGRLFAALGEDSGAAALRAELDARTAELAALEARLRSAYPAYFDLVSPAPLTIAEAQRRLRPDDALLLAVPSGGDLFVFAIAPGRSAWQRIAGAEARIEAIVRGLRCGIDPATCGEARPPAHGFDLDSAHRLYREIVAPLEPALAGAKRLYAATSGALSALPLALLPVELPASASAADADPRHRLAEARWLGDRHALVSLPSVSSLGRLARGDRKLAAAFVGYGDPALDRGEGGRRDAALAGLLFTGTDESGVPLANPALLRRLEPVPGTAVELKAMAGILRAPAESIHLAGAATERAVKESPALAAAGVVAFSTHGLLPNSFGGIAEPGLLLTPPVTPTRQDDGVLTASEVAQMSLAADWVILSACNTATSDGGPGADSLSSLARAFLYAGSRALLASHWRIGDEVTAALVVETLAAERAAPGRGRAAALQSAMRGIRTGRRPDGSAIPGWRAEWVDPAAWAAFTLIATSD
jgi:CHAT domain-containing protein/Flp pilus assembly protein TadD